ncbi:pyridoxal phosphate-dependent aminotransferase [Roseobacter sp. HKCCD5988]|uniref:pyridoxal phosphate-dependent aminotransferase n=1 Tax=Roseobacter sp. HKCCD5988 TaxID=3120338 RepID=UPI001D80DD0D|nr:pyridoxal phosphate-dependent aminotransferase [Rhodobacterales bacterium HKCCD6035]
MTSPRYTKLIDSLPAKVPFVGPEAQERAQGFNFVARLGANESVFGPSPKAIAAMQAAARDVWMYGDPELYNLRNSLAAHHRVAPENIVVGEGIDGLLGYLVRLLVAEGDPVVTSLGAYPTFLYHVAGFGGQVTTVPYKDDHEDPEALLAAARATGAKLLYLANPDNPMGTWHKAEAIERLIAALPPETVLILDEAYADTAPQEAIPAMDVSHPRVIRMRTFSKAYGLAGLRVGYAIGHHELIRAFDKIRNHFGMGRIAQAGALAALKDQDYLNQTVKKISQARAEIARIVQDNGLTPLPSATNFVAVDCGRDGAYAAALLNELTKRGVFLRMPAIAPLNRSIRISCGDAAMLAHLEAELPKALAALG